MIEAEFPEALEFLFEPSRYKILYGGRGSGKSWGVARALLIKGAERPLRILCAREFQRSIADSVHTVLSDQIAQLGLDSIYEVQNTEIRGANGTEFIFAGLRHNVTSIKSMEGLDIAWCEEAHTISKTSWDTLIPTIRKEGSEIWVTMNPELETDETYKRFIATPPPGAQVRKVNWSDNPFFPDVLRVEMEDLKQKDPDAWLNVWEGHPRQMLDGAVYATELRQATEEGRITKVPYERGKPVHTFWDLGYSDKTSIWFAQIVGFEFRVLDFYQDRLKPLDFYLRVLQDRPYVYGTDWLPHDAQAKTLVAGGRTIEQQMREAGRTVRIVPKLSGLDGRNALRTMFPNLWFDAEKCADGLQCLRHYRYDIDPQTGQWSKEPLHDENSHAADAARYMAVALKEGSAKVVKTFKKPILGHQHSGAWMR